MRGVDDGPPAVPGLMRLRVWDRARRTQVTHLVPDRIVEPEDGDTLCGKSRFDREGRLADFGGWSIDGGTFGPAVAQEACTDCYATAAARSATSEPAETAAPTSPGSQKIERIDIAEFRKIGYLQELNRKFLHPHGLALEVVVEEKRCWPRFWRKRTVERLGGVWDYRSDPEGMCFGRLGSVGVERATEVVALWERRRRSRVAALGYMIQPIEDLLR